MNKCVTKTLAHISMIDRVVVGLSVVVRYVGNKVFSNVAILYIFMTATSIYKHF